MILIKRVYEPFEAGDGARYLVDRLWPRGIKKEALHLRAWLKDVAPSNELRHWFHNYSDQWNEFRSRYFLELEANAPAWQPSIEEAHPGSVALLYSSKDATHNMAAVLREFLCMKR